MARRTITGTLLTLVGVMGMLLSGPSATAQPPITPGPPIVITPGDAGGRYSPPSVGIGVGTPGSPGGAVPGNPMSGGGSSAGATGCTWQLQPDMEQWIRRLPGAISRGPGPGQAGSGGSGQDQVDPQSRLYARVCDGVVSGYSWFGPGGPVAGGPPLPTPLELAQQAYTQMKLPAPTAEHSPDLRLEDGRVAVLVGENTWLWTDSTRFVKQVKRLQVGPVWAEVTAIPTGLTFDPGNGDGALSCAGAGTPFVAGTSGEHAKSPTCGYQYQRSSFGLAGGMVTAEYGITWKVSWIGSTGATAAGGQLDDMTSRTTTRYAVAEAQAVVTSSDGSR